MIHMETSSRQRRRVTRWLGVGCLVSVAGLILTILLLPRTSDPRWLPLPVPNGYDELIRSGMELQKGKHAAKDFDAIESGDASQLQALVGPYGAALDRARRALSQECVAPPATGTGSQIDAVIGRTNSIRTVSRFLLAQGKLAEVQGNTTGALECGLDLARLGHATSRGGLLMDALTGFAITTMGQTALRRIQPELTATQCRRAAAVLLALDEKREPIDAILDRERAFGLTELRAQGGRLVELGFRLSGKGEGLLKPAFDSARQSSLRTSAAQRLLAVELAIQAYEQEHGAPPTRFEDLVPGELSAVPQDPYRKGPLTYHRDGTRYHLQAGE